MYQTAKPLFFRTETPMHAGSGSDLGHIDLPIQREKHTDLPNIQSSGLKGAFRQNLEQGAKTDEQKIGIHLTFGYDSDGEKYFSQTVKDFFYKSEDKDYSGSLAFTDARLLLFPIKSFKGVYALATSPSVIKKFIKEIKFICNPTITFNAKEIEVTSDRVAAASPVFLEINGKVILEEYAFQIDSSKTSDTQKLAEELEKLLGIKDKELQNRLVILEDNIFRDFTRLSTEVITRTKIDNATGTVQNGALFTEEYLPSESYLYTIVATNNVFETKEGKDKRKKDFPKVTIEKDTDVMKFFKDNVKDIVQIGGSSTLGKGIVKLFKKQLEL